MNAMTDEDRKAVAEAPALMLAEWWSLLNKWEWPREGLGEPEPEPEPWRPDTRRGAIMNAICECLREWSRENMPGPAFDEWWDSGRNAFRAA
jgi:hypothetical protein